MWRVSLLGGVFGGIEGKDSNLGISNLVPWEAPQSTDLV